MLANGLLQSKKDGLAGLLSSRKRKLEELYCATVNWQAPESPSHHQLYAQNEQAFLDANDITKGRYFDEATLPDRPDFTSLIPPKRPTTHPIALGSLPTKRNDASHLRVSPSRESAGVAKEKGGDVQTGLLDDQDLKRRGSRNQTPSTISRVEPRKRVLSDAATPTAIPDGQSAGLVNSKTATSPLQSLHRLSDASKGDFEQDDLLAIDNDLDLEDTSLELSQGASSQAEKPLGGSQARQTSRSPEVPMHTREDERKQNQRVGVANSGEQASSPNSTVGHHSSNTPGATAISPDTSPENDFLDDDLGSFETTEPATQQADGPNKATKTAKKDVSPGSHTQSLPPTDAQAHIALKSTDRVPVSTPKSTQVLESQMSSIGAPSFENTMVGTGVKSSGSSLYSQELPAKDAVMKAGPERTKPAPYNHSHRPSMKIDTSTGSISSVGDATLSQIGGSANDRFVDSPLSIGTTSATPKRAHAVSISAPSPPERMTTRVSSGALRHKSVSEILGGPPKVAPSHLEKSGPEKASAESSRASSTADPSAPGSGTDVSESGAIRLRQGDRREKERERSKLSTVVFAKPQVERMEGNDLALHDGQRPLNEEKDYLYSLFVSQAYGPPRCPPLRGLLGSAHKTLTTANHSLDLRDQQDVKIMKRIYQLQYTNRWPLRQQERSLEPPRPKGHWDHLLEEMKWMRTDFREERKWKLVIARQCAIWCAEYFASSPDEQSLLRVKVKPHSAPREQRNPLDVEMTDGPEGLQAFGDGDEQLQPTPDLVPSAIADTPSESPVDAPPDFPETAAPAAVFSLSADEVIFGIQRTPATEKLLSELPLYKPFKFVPESENSDSPSDPDASWKKAIVPVSRFVESKIRLQEHKPPTKRSRYEFDLDLEDKSQPPSKAILLASEQTDVALFNPENKSIRDRIHPGHAFRPPSEFPMPSQSFFENRNSSQWTYAEDDELRKLVKEYSYNWSLISSCLASRSLFASGPERRTPWECFERWVSLEGLPSDMSKTQYFRAYHQRLESANRNVAAQQAMAQAAVQAANPGQTMRRRTTQPIRVEKRRGTKYLALLDAMRKLAKKRESTMVKQQQASSLAAMRKPNDAAQPKPPFSTPQEFSRLKYDRELKMEERQQQYRLQVLAHQRAAYAQRSAHQANPQQLPNGVQERNVAAVNAIGSSPSVTSSLPNGHPQAGVPNQARPQPPLQAMPNGAQPNGGLANMGMKGVPVGLAVNGQGPPRLPPNGQLSPDNMRVYLEANRVQQQQQQFLMQQRQQQKFGGQVPNPSQSGPLSSPNMGNTIPIGGNMGSPPMNAATMVNGTSGSPRATQSRPLSINGVVPAINQIHHTIQAQHPHLSPEEIGKLATQHLHKYQTSMSQMAMNAAAGNSGAVGANYGIPNDGSLQPNRSQTGGMGSYNNPQATQQAYAQILRAQQANQQHHRGGSAGANMSNGNVPNSGQGSRGATPQNQRSGSVQAPGAGKSPRPPQAQISS